MALTERRGLFFAKNGLALQFSIRAIYTLLRCLSHKCALGPVPGGGGVCEFVRASLFWERQISMTDPFIAQIVLFGGNFAPSGWAFCSGQLLPIASNTALFSILGTTYGGDGEVTFALPDLRGRSPRGSEGNSAGPGLAAVVLGQKGGSVQHTLVANQLPAHTHALNPNAVEDSGNQTDPAGHFFSETDDMNFSDGSPGANVGPASTGNNSTGNQPISHLDPFLGLNYIIALFGVFPSPN